jgi:glycogen(starch) synthase
VRICILSREYPPQGTYWGSATFYRNLAQALSAREHQVQVVCQAWGGPKTRSDGDVQVHEVGTRPMRGSPLARIDFSLHSFRKIRQLLGENRVDIVDAPLFWGEPLLFALFAGSAPLVVQCHAWSQMLLETRSYQGGVERGLMHLTSTLERITARRASRVVANSRLSYQWLTGRGVSSSKVRLIYEGIDTRFYQPVASSVRSRLHLSDDVPLCLFIGRLQARKGVHILGDAIPSVLRTFPGTRFILVGADTGTAPDGGSFVHYLTRQAQDGGFAENLTLFDFLPEEQILELYSACDTFVFPSLFETFGKPVLEAMACGRPVVATDTGIAAELKGLSPMVEVAAPGDPETLAQAIIRILSVPKEEREHLAASHRQIVEERFSFERMVDGILAVYEEAIAQMRARTS